MINLLYRNIAKLQTIKGLSNINILRAYDKKFIKDNEYKNNIGVFDCLNRQFTLTLTHDSTFRNPPSKISYEERGQLIFPGVPFPEVSGKNVVSSSPSEKIHNYLVSRFKMKLMNNEATLLVGFDT